MQILLRARKALDGVKSAQGSNAGSWDQMKLQQRFLEVRASKGQGDKLRIIVPSTDIKKVWIIFCRGSEGETGPVPLALPKL